jgi:hypothetical protein
LQKKQTFSHAFNPSLWRLLNSKITSKFIEFGAFLIAQSSFATKTQRNQKNRITTMHNAKLPTFRR